MPASSRRKMRRTAFIGRREAEAGEKKNAGRRRFFLAVVLGEKRIAVLFLTSSAGARARERKREKEMFFTSVDAEIAELDARARRD